MQWGARFCLVIGLTPDFMHSRPPSSTPEDMSAVTVEAEIRVSQLDCLSSLNPSGCLLWFSVIIWSVSCAFDITWFV